MGQFLPKILNKSFLSRLIKVKNCAYNWYLDNTMGNVKSCITLFFLSLHTSKNSLITSFAIKLPFLSKPVVFFIQLKTRTWLKHDFLTLITYISSHSQQGKFYSIKLDFTFGSQIKDTWLRK